MQAEHRRVLRQLVQQPIGQFERHAVDQAQLAAVADVGLELGRQLRARLEFGDHFRLIEQATAARTERQLVVQPIRLDGGVGTTRGCLAALTRMLMSFGQSARRQAHHHDCGGGEDSLRAPDGFLP